MNGSKIRGDYNRDANKFTIIDEVQLTATQLLWICNNEHPGMVFGEITPTIKLVETFELKLSTADSYQYKRIIF